MNIGDIFEVKTKKGKAYLQFVKPARDNTEVEKIRVFYNLHMNRPKKLETIVNKESFYLEFALKAAIRKKLISYVGNIPLPEDLIYPKYFRTENVFGEGWRIINSEGGQKVVEELSKEQKKLPPWGTWNYPLLVDNLENEWRLENWL